jgi:hypothetical protein
MEYWSVGVMECCKTSRHKAKRTEWLYQYSNTPAGV